MFYYRDYTFGEAGRIFCLTAISTGKVCCIVANLSEHTYIDRFTFIIPYRISLLIEKNFFESHRNSFHLHFCHCFFFICLNYYLNWNRREDSNLYFNLIGVVFYLIIELLLFVGRIAVGSSLALKNLIRHLIYKIWYHLKSHRIHGSATTVSVTACHDYTRKLELRQSFSYTDLCLHIILSFLFRAQACTY